MAEQAFSCTSGRQKMYFKSRSHAMANMFSSNVSKIGKQSISNGLVDTSCKIHFFLKDHIILFECRLRNASSPISMHI